ncbi:MAG: mevalonate kinase, partial [Candidatus Bilamarchaeaceae archaeon]
NKKQINDFAYEGEKVFHGSPSGIDNYMATYGGFLLFKKGENGLQKQLEIKNSFNVVVGFTGKLSPTAKMVAEVRKLKEDDPEKFTELLEEATELVYKAAAAIEKGKLEEIGVFMNQNQKLLDAIGVSDEKNEDMIKLMLEAGALGAKITGGGGGGCCIALARDKIAAMEIERTLKKKGYPSFTTLIPNK